MELQALIDGLRNHRNGAASYESVDEAIRVFEAMRDVDGEKAVKGLELCTESIGYEGCITCHYHEDYYPYRCRYANAKDALALIRQQQERIKELEAAQKEQEAEGKWIYGEDETGVDGWHCSECGFFEPWFYKFTDDIDFIRFYGHCPSCGRKMTSYTGKPTQNRR